MNWIGVADRDYAAGQDVIIDGGPIRIRAGEGIECGMNMGIDERTGLVVRYQRPYSAEEVLDLTRRLALSSEHMHSDIADALAYLRDIPGFTLDHFAVWVACFNQNKTSLVGMAQATQTLHRTSETEERMKVPGYILTRKMATSNSYEVIRDGYGTPVFFFTEREDADRVAKQLGGFHVEPVARYDRRAGRKAS